MRNKTKALIATASLTVVTGMGLMALHVLRYPTQAQSDPSDGEPETKQARPADGFFFPGCLDCSVVLITIDTVRADYLPCYGSAEETSPRLCGLGASARLYERAISAAPATLPALASLMTGVIVSNESLAERLAVADQANYLAERLAAKGYTTAGIVDHHALGTLDAPGRQSGFLHRGFAEFQNHGDMGVTDTGSEVTSAGATWLEAHASERFFLWLHYFGPHFPYAPTAEDAARFGYERQRCGRIDEVATIEELRQLTATVTKEELDCVKALYRAELFRTDAWIGEILEAVEQLGLSKKTLVVLTADHGEEFLDRNRFGHERTVYEELVHVPLVIRHPQDTAPLRVAEPVSTAWLFDLLTQATAGQSTSWSGDVLTRTHRDYWEKHQTRFRSEPNTFALYESEWKILATPSAHKLQWFELASDPGERHPLDPASTPAATAGRRLTHWLASPEVPRASKSNSMNELLRLDFQRLEKLGYFE